MLTLLLTGLAGGFLLWRLYRALLPQPIPGIPYNPEALNNILGDIPRLERENLDSPVQWLVDQSSRLGSPIVQLFIRPFSKPLVVLADVREAQDIMMRRKEFERSPLTKDILIGEARTFHIVLDTDAEWKAHRNLIKDLMIPSFLHDVAAPNIYNSACRLLNLWEMKAGIADGAAFSAEQDICYAGLDAVLDFGFGDDPHHRALVPQVRMLQAAKRDQAPGQSRREREGSVVTFPAAPLDAFLAGVIQTSETVAGMAANPFPRLAWWWVGLSSKVRKRRALVDNFARGQVEMAAKKLESSKSKVENAIDFILQRENANAEQEGRAPAYWSDTIRDETLGFIIAGSDTTSTALCWGVKYLADSQACQVRLREALHAAHPGAVARKTLPSHEEIVGTDVPYLEAVIEEILRLSHPVVGLDRVALEDTVVLGHRIPKSTIILMGNDGPSITEPAHTIDENLRSEASRKAARSLEDRGIQPWDDDALAHFVPERWLRKTADTAIEKFDPQSGFGSTLPFGAGRRGCYGRKLAYMEMRLILTLLIWSFELQQCPEELSSHDSYESLTRKPRKCYVKLKSLRKG